ncbi:hypothetical protein [Streptomyces cyaneofuscatus]|uniref:hypothetical protein n=1 Tax=Streptomyces cyaneofuscatus TaxID=66883 RepID=UPI00343F19B0
MSPVENLLRPLLDVPGVTGAALVDGITGLTYGEVGGQTPDAEECSRLAVTVADRLHAAGARGGLESIVVTGARHQVVLRTCPRQGDPLLLTAALERDQANLALVMHQLGRHAEKAAG